MTAGARAEDRARCLAAGMDDFLSNPVKRADLERMLAPVAPLRAVGHRRLTGLLPLVER